MNIFIGGSKFSIFNFQLKYVPLPIGMIKFEYCRI